MEQHRSTTGSSQLNAEKPQPKVEQRRYRPTTQLQQEQQPHTPILYTTGATNSQIETPVSARESLNVASSWGAPSSHNNNIGSWNNIHANNLNNRNEGVGTKSCLAFPKHALGNKISRNRGGATTSTNSSVGSSTNSGRFSKARSFLRRSTDGSGRSAHSRAASSQSSQNSSNAPASSNNYRGLNLGQNQRQPLQPQQNPPNYASDDEYATENADSWLLKESSNYTPWSVSSVYGEKANTEKTKAAVVSPETNGEAIPGTYPSVEHLLTLPPVEDRSDRKRIEYEQRLRNSMEAKLSNPRRRGVYEGELEPEGVRGQEARVVTPSSGSTTQQFLPTATSKDYSFQIIKPVIPPSSTGLHSRKGVQQKTLVDIPEESYDSSSVSNDAGTPTVVTKSNEIPIQHLEQQQQQQQQQQRIVTPNETISQNSIKKLHQHRPSGLIPPPPSRVKSSRHYNIPNEPIKLSGAHNNNDIETPQNANLTPTVNDSMANDNQEKKQSSLLTSRSHGNTMGDQANNDIPWVRSSQISMPPTLQNNRGPQMQSRKMSTDSESSVGVAPYPTELSIVGRNTKAVMTNVANDEETAKLENLHTTASNAVRSGKFDVALTAFNTILQIQLERNGRSHAATAAAYHNLGTVYAKRASMINASNDDDEEAQRQSRMAALECFQAAARCARDASADIEHPHPNVAVSLVRVGFLLLQAKQYQNAIVTFQEALRIRITHYGKLHALSANLYNNLGVCCLHMGEFEQGLYHLEQALEIQRHLVSKTGRGSPKHQGNESAIAAHQLELADTLFNIGGLCLEWMRRQGPDARRADEAEAAFLECLQLRSHVLGQAHPQTLQVKSLYGIAKSVPRPRRILKTPPTPMPTTKRVANIIDRGEGSITHRDNSITQRSYDNHTDPSHMLRSNQRSVSPVKIPPMSPFGPLSEVSSIVHDDSNDATSIFRVGGSNNTSPQRQDTLTSEILNPSSGKAQESNVKSNTLKPSTFSNNDKEPPLLQITVSLEEGEKKNDVSLNDATKSGTHIYMASHLVPNSPSRLTMNDSGHAQANETSFDKDNFTVDTSSEMPHNTSSNSMALPQVSSYDTEENCIISDNGVDSEVGRIHYPLAWNRAGIVQSSNSGDPSKTSNRDIMVMQPIRQLQQENTHRLKNNDKSDTASTGNMERDDILARARAILTAHDPNKVGIVSNDLVDERDGEETDVASTSLDHDVDDGIASLGGYWGGTREKKMIQSKRKLTVQDMLRDPMGNLPEIHQEASRQLQNGNTVDAYRLFDVVLQCQRHTHGPLHPDVAAALHNVGIVQLRSQNHSEALKAFEEAARVRKGSLGKDHPLVAVR
jgi:tetratricopeptide (TPR) repeat protein